MKKSLKKPSDYVEEMAWLVKMVENKSGKPLSVVELQITILRYMLEHNLTIMEKTNA